MITKPYFSRIKDSQAAKKGISDFIQGCLLGGAYGDALGYPVEFLKYSQIKACYGKDGITELLQKSGKAEISDDTQMTLFTANALLFADTIKNTKKSTKPLNICIFEAYRAWYCTQYKNTHFNGSKQFWIYNIDELHSSRAPGSTCLSAIEASEGKGSIDNPVNNSKGCGGVMRVAPIGCYFAPEKGKAEIAAYEGAQAAALTHGHTLGYIPAAFLSCLVYKIIFNKTEEHPQDLYDIVEDTNKIIRNMFQDREHFAEFDDLIKKSIELSKSDLSDIECINSLGQGWVAEEALAIALYAALKYKTDFKKAVICSVNHDGDSDSAGAVTGNILGAYLGLSFFDKDGSLVTRLEVHDVIFELANDLAERYPANIHDVKWLSKYLYATYGARR